MAFGKDVFLQFLSEEFVAHVEVRDEGVGISADDMKNFSASLSVFLSAQRVVN